MQQNGAINGVVSEHAAAQTTEVSSTQPPPAAAASASRAVQHCFSEEVLDNTLHFQIMDLGRQLYIWVGTGAAQMGSLAMASPLGAQTGASPSSDICHGSEGIEVHSIVTAVEGHSRALALICLHGHMRLQVPQCPVGLSQ